MIQNILLIDNLDSFSFNLVEAVQRLGAHVKVVRNTIPAGAALAEAEQAEAMILLSPGPGRPEDAGCCIELIAIAMPSISAWMVKRSGRLRVQSE